MNRPAGVYDRGQVPQPSDELHRRWIEALGQVVYWFGQLEWCSYWIVDTYAPGGLTKEIAEAYFEPRMILAEKVMAEHLRQPDDVELLRRWNMLIDKLRQDAKQRNRIVHNPLSVRIFRDDAGVEFQQLALATLRASHVNAGTIGLQEVEGFVKRLEVDCVTMHQLIQDTRALAPP
jgi:hypothetical protein